MEKKTLNSRILKTLATVAAIVLFSAGFLALAMFDSLELKSVAAMSMVEFPAVMAMSLALVPLSMGCLANGGLFLKSCPLHGLVWAYM